jgi:predicted metal-dependent peptidase
MNVATNIPTIPSNVAAAEQILRKAHVRLMRHRKTYFYSGVLLLGTSTVDNRKCSTACTDGINKYYNSDFLMDKVKTLPKVAGLVLHEALHVFLKQIPRHRDLWEKDPRVTNAAADYVVNAIIKAIEIEDRAALAAANSKEDPVVILPDGGLYDEKFINWSLRQVYNFLKKEDEEKPEPPREPPRGPSGNDENEDEDDDEDKGDSGNGGNAGNDEDKGDEGDEGDEGDDEDTRTSVTVDGKEYSLETLDDHDTSGVSDLTDDEIKEMIDQIDRGIQEAGLLAGVSNVKLPRAVQELMEPEVRWEDVLRDFFVSQTRGNTDYTFSKFNRRRIVDDIYRPSTYNERAGSALLAIDTSGSISQAEINRVTSLMVMLCEQCVPEELIVLWWDTVVHGEQRFTEDSYANLRSALKPKGFGGTRVSCVSDYMKANNTDADFVIVFTDGYVESDITWTVRVPTLWVVKGNEQFVPPAGGKMVVFK